MPAVRLTAVWMFVLVTIGCASGPRARVASAVESGDLPGALEAYERFRATEGADPQLLARIAVLLLEREARSDDEDARRAAVQQLALAGTAGTPVLERLAVSEGVTPVRLAALEALARRGRIDARLALRALADDDDPQVVAASILGMDPALDQELLLTLARSPHVRVRRNALDALAARAEDEAVAALLAEAARSDADPTVRATAVRALGRAGTDAVAMLRERLSDADPGVRLAAVAALAASDAMRGALAPMIEVATSVTGIEAARLLLAHGVPTGELASAARAFLGRALSASDPTLRAQAGVAVASLPLDREPPLDALRAALRSERDPEVRLSLARALFRHDEEAARGVLAELLGAEGAMPRVQAAALLASSGDARAREVLVEVLASDAPSIVRRTAARALARDALAPDAARNALVDDDALVRIYAAGGILAAAVAT
jgi:HEAT repeat protein